MLGAMQYTKPIEEARIGCEPCKQRSAKDSRAQQKCQKNWHWRKRRWAGRRGRLLLNWSNLPPPCLRF